MFRRKSENNEKGYAGDSAGYFASQRVTRTTLAWIMVAQGIAIAPLFYFLPTWLMAIWVLAITTRIQIYRGVWPYPSGAIKLLFGIAGGFGLYWSYGSFGVEPMIGFMLVAFVLKLIEVRNRADVLIVLYISFVAIATQMLLSQSVWMSAYSLLSCTVILAALGSVFRYRPVSTGAHMLQASQTVAKSIPLMLLLFLVMPRMGQLWAVPALTGAANTGFSDHMSPGDFSQLVKSDDIAFRVSFKNGNIPPQAERYWRGLVLESFDGQRWSRRGGRWMPVESGAVPATMPHSRWNLEARTIQGRWQSVGADHSSFAEYQYSILLEPHNYQWLFTLMAPIKASANKTLLFAEPVLLVAPTPVSARLQYDAVSVHQYRVNADNNNQNGAYGLSRNLIIPEKGNPLAKKLVSGWVREGKNKRQMIAAALEYYRQSFTYTLRPPRLGENGIDQFLFETQKGFCEHFSSSFTYLMRAAGIPARVVVGYLGGEYKSEHDYLIVRQSDAHAWSEVWLPDSGWVRVDPTSAVSPERIENSLWRSVSEEEEKLVGGAFMRIGALAWVAGVRYKLEEWDYLWQVNVLGYNEKTKDSVLSRLLGKADPLRISVFFVGVLVTLMLVYHAASFLLRKKTDIPPEKLLLGVLLRKLARRGMVRFRYESVSAFSCRLAAENPAMGAAIKQIADLYNKIAYNDQKELIPLLREQVKRMARNF